MMPLELKKGILELCKMSYDQGIRDGIQAAADMLEKRNLVTPVMVAAIRAGAKEVPDSPKEIWEKALDKL